MPDGGLIAVAQLKQHDRKESRGVTRASDPEPLQKKSPKQHNPPTRSLSPTSCTCRYEILCMICMVHMQRWKQKHVLL